MWSDESRLCWICGTQLSHLIEGFLLPSGGGITHEICEKCMECDRCHRPYAILNEMRMLDGCGDGDLSDESEKYCDKCFGFMNALAEVVCNEKPERETG